MKASSTSGMQRVKQWALLIGAVAAIVIWTRNLTIILPCSDSNVSEDGVPDATLAQVHLHAVPSAETFHGSAGWVDFFRPDLPKSKVSNAAVTRTENAIPKRVEEIPPPPWSLTGVVWDPLAPTAILSSLDGQRQIIVTKGDSVGSARVERISDTVMWLRQGRKKWVLSLGR